MNTSHSYEYYSTFAPVAGAFLADEPSSGPMNPFRMTQSLKTIDKGYTIYSARKPSLSHVVSGHK